MASSTKQEKSNFSITLKLSLFLLILFWTLIIAGSLWFNMHNTYAYSEAAARIQARTAFEKDVIYRNWNSMLGGVFAKITETSPPNPYLEEEGRDVTTDNGLKLTKINPAYMTRLIHEMGAIGGGVRGHITSNDPIRPANKPSEWEAQALVLLESGQVEEVSEIRELDGEDYLHFIRPLMVQESCMPCHAFQGYKVGEVRGGISVYVPMAPFNAAASANITKLLNTHIFIWFLGVMFFTLGFRKMMIHGQKRDYAEGQLFKLNQELEQRVSDAIDEVEKRQAALQNFMNNTDGLAYLKDSELRYTMANRNYELLTKSYTLLQGKDNIEVGLHAQIFEDICNYEKEVLTTQEAIHPEKVFAFDNSGKLYAAAIFPVFGKSKDIEGIGAMFFDVTQRIAVEETLRIAQQEAESANKVKSEFLANMSHEIRTPMNGILGLLHLFNSTQLDNTQKSYAEKMDTSAKNLMRIINDILDFSKMEAGKMEMEKQPFILHGIGQEVSDLYGHICAEKGLILDVSCSEHAEVFVLGDALRLKQVIFNLISNAIKFTNSGGKIFLEAESFIHNDAELHCTFTISDTGIGLSNEQVQKLFLAFSQADSSVTRKYGGTGLGLIISKRIINLMGGDIWVESELGKGTIFTFTTKFPIASDIPQEKDMQFEHGDMTLAPHSGHLLIVEDNEINQIVVQEILHAVGYTLDIADNGQMALEMLEKNAYDCVLMDIQMPVMDGYTATKIIRQQEKFAKLPIIAMSAHAMKGDREVSLTHGMNEHITKPIDAEILYKTLQTWMLKNG